PMSPIAYAAAKAGIEVLTPELSAQVGPYGIRANCIAPETILTERNKQRIPSAQQQDLVALHPIKRLGTPADVAHAALYLACDDATWLAGITLDGRGGHGLKPQHSLLPAARELNTPSCIPPAISSRYQAVREDRMRYKPKSTAALHIALGGLPDKMRVEVDPDIRVSAKTVGELRRVTAWPENLALTTRQEGYPESSVKVNKANVATRVTPKT